MSEVSSGSFMPEGSFSTSLPYLLTHDTLSINFNAAAPTALSHLPNMP